MDIPKRLQALEQQAKKHNVRMDDACREARIDYTTYWRWREGKSSPGLDAWERLQSAVKTLCDTTAAV